VLALGLIWTFNVNADDAPPYKDASVPVDRRVADLLSRMTVEEKVGQLSFLLGWGMYQKTPDGSVTPSDAFKKIVAESRTGGLWGLQRADPWTKVTLRSGLSSRQAAEALNALQKYAIENSRLGIPLLLAEECPHGHMAIGATVFPTGIGQASTWNPELIHQMARAVAAETRACGATIGYGPVLDLAREPRWSRVEETFGEDPVLARELAVAVVRGFQGDDLKSNNSVLSTLKHFAAHGIPEGGHNAGPAAVGPRQLRADLLPPFRAAIRAGAGSVMSAYNEIDGVPCSGDPALLTGLLRNEWGFNGFVVSDLYAIDGLVNGQRVAASFPDAAAMAINAGVDADLGGNVFHGPLLTAVKDGRVSMDVLDRAAGRVLTTKFKLGLFDNAHADPDVAERTARSPEHRDLARNVARQSIILLKNSDNVLPLKKDVASIAVIGPNADSVYNQLGDYTAPQPDGAVITVLEGIRKAVSPNTAVRYARGCGIRSTVTDGFADALAAVKQSDVAVVVLGGSSARDFNVLFDATGAAKPAAALDASGAEMEAGEGFDRASLDLAGVQLDLLKQIVAIGKPVVLVMIQGRPLNLNWPTEHVPAILCAWYAGEQGGNAVADVLFGDYNPAGRLPISVPRSVGQLPVYYNHKPSARRDYVDESAKPLFPFGFGLSYSTFKYENATATVTGSGDSLSVSTKVDVTNTGPRDGDEVVQLYLRDDVSSVTTPDRAMKAFNRVTLKSGEKQTVEFTLTPEDLAILDRDMKWRVEPGSFTVMIGASSADIRQTTRFTVK
jgi:beta-glucosidase